jgi:hypothetical protein
MPTLVSNEISDINEKIDSANRKAVNSIDTFLNITKYVITISTLYSLPYYYYFFTENLFT